MVVASASTIFETSFRTSAGFVSGLGFAGRFLFAVFFAGVLSLVFFFIVAPASKDFVVILRRRAICAPKDLGEPREASRCLRRDNRALGSLPKPPKNERRAFKRALYRKFLFSYSLISE
jgi:hypothetical protein